MKIAELKAEMQKYVVIKDPYIIDVIMATLIGNLPIIRREPIWIMIVAPSSGGKTTLIAPAIKVPNTKFVDDMTEKTLLSGFKGGKNERSKSLLDEIGPHGIMVFSDFTAMLSKNPNSRGEILGQLRMVYDGTFIKRTGIGETSWRGKMGFLGASTPEIYHLLEQGKALGERFTYYCLMQPTDKDIAEMQKTCHISSKEVTDILAPMYAEIARGIKQFLHEKGVPDLSMTIEQEQVLEQCAIFATNGKATVHTDFRTGQITGIPHKAGIGRDIKMFKSILHTLQCMHAYEADDMGAKVTDDDLNIIKKCAYSSVNRERRKILEILAQSEDGEGISASTIGTLNGLGLNREAVVMHLSPLHSVGLIQKDTSSSTNHKYKINNPELKKFILEASALVADTVVNHASVEPDIVEKVIVPGSNNDEWMGL